MKKEDLKIPLIILVAASTAFVVYDLFKRFVQMDFNFDNLDVDEDNIDFDNNFFNNTGYSEE